MTWRSVISSKLLTLVFACGVSGPIHACTVTGSIQLVQSSDSAVKKKRDLSGVVVWLTSSEGPSQHIVRKHTEMLQKDKKFSPHILAIETGTTVDFPNLDPIFHNAFSNYDGQVFDVALYPPGSSRAVRFDRPGIVRVFCNIHPTMSAIIVVLDSGHFTTTDRGGRYSLPNVSPGTYEVHFFHERATPETLTKATQRIVVSGDNETLTLPPATISESGYLPAAHKNKYGQDYPVDAGKADNYSPQVR
jgi:plastocyanin